ncbi:MAG: NifB/NifX family molybdenum-iron cluster-binding protein [Planctomycetota bacterium]
MKIAIPVSEGKLCAHFGMARQFAFVDADAKKRQVRGVEILDAPDHEPGILPRWIRSQGVEIVIVGGMGGRAQGLFAEAGIKCIIGAPEEGPEKLVKDYLNGDIKTGENVCKH